VKKQTFRNYYSVLKLINDFEEKEDEKLLITTISGRNNREFKKEKVYWKRFYKRFSKYLYEDLDHYDNYVGSQFKVIRTFMIWLREDKGMNLADFHKLLHVHKENIEITVLSPERLNFLIYNKDFHDSLNRQMQQVKDTFVFGCTVSLRVSDLMKLKRTNIIPEGERTYLRVVSTKTKAATRVLLPSYATEIIERNKSRSSYILPRMSIGALNKKIKELMKEAGWNEIRGKTRTKRGITCQVYKNKKSKEPYRFSDLITTHTMRRTAITTMLRLGMDEINVRKISGHAAGSVEFFKYVKISQNHLDEQTLDVYQKLQKIG
jgi:integrase